MIYYSHRGNIEGSNPDKENNPLYIDKAIELGFHVEIDLIVINKTLYLGHDFPQYKINENFLKTRKNKILIHAKNILALQYLISKDYHYFAHSSDPFIYTSKKYIWIHSFGDNIKIDKKLKAIVPLITKDLVDSFEDKNIYGVCSDYIKHSKNKFK